MEFFFQLTHCCNANCNRVSGCLCSLGLTRRAPHVVSSPVENNFHSGDSFMCNYRILTLSSVLALSCFLPAFTRAADVAPADAAAAPANPNAASPDPQPTPSDSDSKATQNLESVVVTGR